MLLILLLLLLLEQKTFNDVNTTYQVSNSGYLQIALHSTGVRNESKKAELKPFLLALIGI